MTCATIMTANPRSVLESETIGHAAEQILERKYINLPVVDGEGRLVGLFGIYDLLALLVPRIAVVGDLIPNLRFMSDDLGELHEKFAGLRNAPIRQAANREPATVFPDTPIIEAVRLFCRNHMTIPVVERETRRLAGMISYWDAARAIMNER
jgi:CBS-domain-containing membrane protein